MKYQSALCQLSMADVERLYGALVRLNAVDDAIMATSLQGKPAMRELLRDIYTVVHGLMRKAARRACKLGAEGAYVRKNLPPELMTMLIEMASGPEVAEESADGLVRNES